MRQDEVREYRGRAILRREGVRENGREKREEKKIRKIRETGWKEGGGGEMNGQGRGTGKVISGGARILTRAALASVLRSSPFISPRSLRCSLFSMIRAVRARVRVHSSLLFGCSIGRRFRWGGKINADTREGNFKF